MKEGKNIFWGLIFLVGAFALLAGKMGLLEGIGFWSILFTICLVGGLIDGIYHRSWGTILFSLASLAIVNDDVLGIEKLTPWPVLGAALLATIGLNMIFPFKHRKKKHISIGADGEDRQHFFQVGAGFGDDVCDVMTNSEGGEYVRIEASFQSMSRYIQSPCLSLAQIENSFGTLHVYFDNAVLKNDRAFVNIENSFGHVNLYIPARWRVIFDTESSFGSVVEHGTSNALGSEVLTINGNVAFGRLEIYYIEKTPG